MSLLTCAILSSAPSDAQAQAQPVSPQLAATIQLLQAKVQNLPQDAKLRFQLGKALRLSGDQAKAASELLEATALEPGLFIAYHELVLSKPTNAQLDEAIERLNQLKNERPKELMLRVALSEVLELRGDCYGAARALIDLVYDNGVPVKYLSQVQARIHFLLSQTKDVQTAQTAKSEDAGLDALPAPLPESPMVRSIAANKPKNGNQTPGFGHSTLLP